MRNALITLPGIFNLSQRPDELWHFAGYTVFDRSVLSSKLSEFESNCIRNYEYLITFAFIKELIYHTDYFPQKIIYYK